MNFEDVKLNRLKCIYSSKTLIYTRDVYLYREKYIIVVFTNKKYTVRSIFDFEVFERFNIDKVYPEFKVNSNVWRVVYHHNGKKSQFTRLITDCDKDSVVDHINRNTLDNRSKNLRNVSKSLNGRNCIKPKSDDILPTGVVFDYRINTYGERYIRGVSAYMRVGKTSKSKFFSLRKYTLEDAIKHASKTRSMWIKEIKY